jgi:hypothetical protein
MTDRNPMLSLLPTLVALAGTAIFASIAIRTRKSRRPTEVLVPIEASEYALSAVRIVRLKILIAVIAGILVAISLNVAPVPALHLGLGATIAPGVGAIVTCLVISTAPLPRPVGASTIRQADLIPRSASSFGPTWGLVLPLASAGVLVSFLVATAVLSSTDERGLWRQIEQWTPGGYEDATPYPGWFYVVPLLVVTALLSLFVLIALRRIAGARSLGTPQLDDFDQAIRRSLTRFVMLLSSSIIVLYLGAAAFTAGSATRTVTQWSKPSALFFKQVEAAAANGTDPTFHVKAGDFIHGVVQPEYTAAAIETTLGIVLIGFALTLSFLAMSSVRIRWTAVAPTQANHGESVPV